MIFSHSGNWFIHQGYQNPGVSGFCFATWYSLFVTLKSLPASFQVELLVSWRYLHWRAEVLAAGGYTVLIADLLGDESKTLPVDCMMIT